MQAEIGRLIGQYGYGVVALVVGVEGLGLPVPGETVLLAAAVLAGTQSAAAPAGGLSIAGVIIAAVLGAIAGDNLGYLLGRRIGFPLVLRHGAAIGLTESRLRLGQYLFLRHGGKLVLVARFVALLRALAALLAGINCMPWPRFAAFNALGCTLWATLYGLGAYLLGRRFHALMSGFGMLALGVLAVALLAGVLALRRYHGILQAQADAALPGPLARR